MVGGGGTSLVAAWQMWVDMKRRVLAEKWLVVSKSFSIGRFSWWHLVFNCCYFLWTKNQDEEAWAEVRRMLTLILPRRSVRRRQKVWEWKRTWADGVSRGESTASTCCCKPGASGVDDWEEEETYNDPTKKKEEKTKEQKKKREGWRNKKVVMDEESQTRVSIIAGSTTQTGE